MRYLEDFRGCHKEDGEIWIIGGGPSLQEFYRKKFFDDKISIACNWAWTAFPEATYYHFYHAVFIEFMMNGNIPLFKKTILCVPNERVDSPEEFSYEEFPIWMNYEGTLTSSEHDEERAHELAAQNVKLIMEGKPCRYGGLGSVVHRAIQQAAVFGAKDIILVGCEHVWTNNLDRTLSHAKCLAPYYIGETRIGVHREEYMGFAKQIQRGTKFFADEFAKYGVNVRKYFYQKGYQEI